jgi:2-dehydropantoate 2-reductase
MTSTDRLHIAVVGPGAIGGLVGARLAARTPHAVLLCGRRAFTGLELDAPDGRLRVPLGPELDPVKVGPVDWVIFAVKAHQTAGAAMWLARLVGAGTRVAVLQNGVEHVDRLAPFVERDRLLPVIVRVPSESPAPGRVVQRGGMELTAPESAAGEAFRALLDGTGVAVRLAADFVTDGWSKLCSNAAAGGITAITGAPIGVMRRPDIAALARALVEEAMAVGRAEGARFPDRFADALMAEWLAQSPDDTTSILLDRLAGRSLEYDARNAVVVRLGERHGIPTPVSRAVTALLAAISDRA